MPLHLPTRPCPPSMRGDVVGDTRWIAKDFQLFVGWNYCTWISNFGFIKGKTFSKLKSYVNLFCNMFTTNARQLSVRIMLCSEFIFRKKSVLFWSTSTRSLEIRCYLVIRIRMDPTCLIFDRKPNPKQWFCRNLATMLVPGLNTTRFA